LREECEEVVEETEFYPEKPEGIIPEYRGLEAGWALPSSIL